MSKSNWGGRRPNAGRKSLQLVGGTESKTPTVPAAPEPSAKTKNFDIARTAAAVAQLIDMRKDRDDARKPRTFTKISDLHPPSARPRSAAGLAMDSSLSAGFNANFTWAGDYLGQVAAEGLTFLGYPYLAELSQRAEYRIIVETIAREMTRKWIRFSAKGDEDKTDKINELVDHMEHFHIQRLFADVATQDGYFGRGHLYVEYEGTSDEELAKPIGTGKDAASKVKLERGKLKGFKTIEATWCYPQAYNANNPLDPTWYRPMQWYVMGQEIHVTRLLPFIGRPVPDLLKPGYSFGGLSLTQLAKPYVDNWLRTRQSVADIIHSFSVMVLSTDLQTSIQAGGEQLFARAQLFDHLRDNNGLMMVNKDTEQLDNVAAPLGSLDTLQQQSMEHMATVARIPIVKFFGDQPQGLNASADGAIRTFYDTIHTEQNHTFKPNLETVINLCQIDLWGKVDPDIVWQFVPLWSMSEKEEAELRKTNAETGQLHIDSGVISQEEERKRIATDPGSLYQGLDVDDMPDLVEEEEGGLVPKGAGSAVAKREDDDDGGGDDDGPGGARDSHPFSLDAEFNESDHPRVKGGPNAGQFGEGGGSSSGSEEGGEGQPKAGSYGGLWKSGGKSFAEDVKTNANSVIEKPSQIGIHYRRMVSFLVKNVGKIANPEHFKGKLELKLVDALQKSKANAIKNGKADEASKLQKTLSAIGKNPSSPDLADAALANPYSASATPAPAAPAVEPEKKPAPVPEGAKKKAYATKAIGLLNGVTNELEKAKAYIKAAVQTDNPLEVALGSMTSKQQNLVKEQYGSAEKAYEKANAYWEAEKTQKAAAEVQKQKQSEAQAAAKKKQAKEDAKFLEAMNTPEAKEHYKVLSDIMGGGSGAKEYLKSAEKRIDAAGLSGKIEPYEAAQIMAYTGSHYGPVNKQLREGVMTEQQWGFARSLDRALDKLPAHTGKTYRKASISNAVLDSYKPGMVIEERGFTSSSKNQGTWNGSVTYEIHGKNGKDVQKLSNHHAEGEVLFKMGSRFKVKIKTGQHVVMEEV